jgi:hypothetical protein
MFDYSSNVDSASKSFLHQSQFAGINRNVFARDAAIRSWGCHTGEMMSKKWREATGTRMWGVIGKTQYMSDELPVLVQPGAKWSN